MSHELPRRLMLSGLACAAMSATAMARTRPAGGRGFFQRIGKPIGLQVYTLGDEAGKDIDATFTELARIGYRDIEMPGLLGKTPEALKAAAARAGLKISSLHLPLMAMPGGGGVSLLSPAQQVADLMGALGAKDAVAPIAPFPAGFRPAPGEDMKAAIGRSFAEAGADHWKRAADQLNQVAAALKPLGVRTGYHNHNIEFLRFGDRTGWDILTSATDPKLVFFEIDLGWVAAAGQNPAAFLQRHAGRVKWLHIKDLLASTQVNTVLGMDPTQVGEGEQDWKAILPVAARIGVEHYYVEQEPPFAVARMEAVRRAYAYLSTLKA